MGSLFVCATPIGNLDDVTPRLLKTLNSVDLIVAEDTRRTQKLLNKFKIKTHTISYHKHSIARKTDFILDLLLKDKKVALVSDGGTPVISDPGSELVNLALKNKIKVVPIPGSCAAVAALSVSGLPADKFCFEGFLPRKPAERRARLKELSGTTRAMVFYEAPHRLLKTLSDILLNLGDREITVAREITKKFEEIIKNKASKVLQCFKNQQPKGEFVIVVSGAGSETAKTLKSALLMEKLIAELQKNNISNRDIAKVVSKCFGVSKKLIYNKLIEC